VGRHGGGARARDRVVVGKLADLLDLVNTGV
jgi:hypothetical protein